MAFNNFFCLEMTRYSYIVLDKYIFMHIHTLTANVSSKYGLPDPLQGRRHPAVPFGGKLYSPAPVSQNLHGQD